MKTEFISIGRQFVIAMASASVSTTVIGMTGPKISSRNAGISGVTSASTVGR